MMVRRRHKTNAQFPDTWYLVKIRGEDISTRREAITVNLSTDWLAAFSKMVQFLQ
jgi:hypothetical protein